MVCISLPIFFDVLKADQSVVFDLTKVRLWCKHVGWGTWVSLSPEDRPAWCLRSQSIPIPKEHNLFNSLTKNKIILLYIHFYWLNFTFLPFFYVCYTFQQFQVHSNSSSSLLRKPKWWCYSVNWNKCPNKTYIFVSMDVKSKKTQWVKCCAWVYRSQQLQSAVCCHNNPHTDRVGRILFK